MNAECRRQKAEKRRRFFCILPSAFCILSALNLLAAPADSWLRSHAIPLASVEPSADDSDLAPLLPLVANAHVIGLGDATHRTHEFYAVKQRLIRFLVKNANVRTIAFEAPFGEFEGIREYVRTGAGDPAALLRNDDYFFWNTDEVLDTIRWVRAWNAAGNPPVDIIGVDPFHTRTSIARLAPFVGDDAYRCIDRLTIASSQRSRDACHAAVMSVRPALTSPEAIYAARIVEEGEESLDRDSAMAENLERFADRAGSGNFIFWAHNEHVGRNGRSAGQLLTDRYAAGYVAIGTIALRGSFNAVDGLHAMGDATSDDFASMFAAASIPRMIVPLRALPPSLAGTHPMRIAGSDSQTTAIIDADLAKQFDAMIYIEVTTPARVRP